jgi:hypothetical protein
MPKYVAIFGTKKPLTPASYPALFKHLTSLAHGARFTDAVLGFHSEEERADVIATLLEHLGPKDELTVFEVDSAVWRLNPEHDAMMKKFLDASGH